MRRCPFPTDRYHPIGPTTNTDAYWRTSHSKYIRRTDFSKGFHTFGLEWSQDYLFTYLDNRLEQVLYWSFPSGQTMWQAGHFAGETVNQSLLVDPWSQTGRTNTPFDQPFYLILNVAVGSTNGFFPDGMGNKPWTDEGNAPSDFYKGVYPLPHQLSSRASMLHAGERKRKHN